MLLKLDTWAIPFYDGPIQGFAIAGEDGRFQPAKAEWFDKNEGKGASNWDRSFGSVANSLCLEPGAKIRFPGFWRPGGLTFLAC